MKIIFFGTDNFALTVLKELQAHHEVLAVVTTPDAPVGRKQILQASPVATLAHELGLRLFKPASLRKDPTFKQTLQELGADIFTVVVYGKIIPDDILSIPRYKSVNVHPSLLPRYRGPAPIRTPLYNGDSATGVTIMLMDSEVDHGPILAQEEVAIGADDTNCTLTDKLALIAAPLLIKTIDGYVTGAITPREQDHSQAIFTRLVTKQDGRIDWSRTAPEIYNQFRAYSDWPSLWTMWDDTIVKILDCEPANMSFSGAPGTVLPEGLIVCGKNTVLKITQLQLAGKNPVDIKSFLNGYKDFISSTLI